MSEYIVDDQLVQGIINEAYRKGKGGAEVWTQREWRQEPVVRCKDCAHADELEDGTLDCHGYLVETWDYYNDEPKQNIVLHDGFCAWGHRKVEGSE